MDYLLPPVQWFHPDERNHLTSSLVQIDPSNSSTVHLLHILRLCVMFPVLYPDSTTTSDLRRIPLAEHRQGCTLFTTFTQPRTIVVYWCAISWCWRYTCAPPRGVDGIRVRHLVKLISTTFFVSIHTCLMDNIFITFLHFLYLWVYQFVKWILFEEVQYIFEVLSHNMLEKNYIWM